MSGAKTPAHICQACDRREGMTCRADGRPFVIVASSGQCPLRHDLEPLRRLSVAAIVTCHNYGRFLRQCLESLLRQTTPFSEIVVVDDASNDNTQAVAESFKPQGVKYLRVERRDRVLARRDGLGATASPVLLWVDADDWLAPDYLERQLPLLADRNIGVVFGDYIKVFPDGREELSRFPAAADRDLLAGWNVVPNISLVRRAAIEIAQALQQEEGAEPEDWKRWRIIAQAGWKLVKGPGLHFYRQHPASWTSSMQARRATYNQLWHLTGEAVTIALPLSGRWAYWPALSRWLARQTHPRGKCELLVVDSSCDDEFGRMIRHWLAASEYDRFHYHRRADAEQGLADLDRRGRPDVQRRVEHELCRIWTLVAQAAQTDWVLTLEDDVLPPDDVIGRLLASVDSRRVAAVFAPYQHRYWEHYCHWDESGAVFRDRGRGCVRCGGGGFGCTLIRREVLRSQVFWPDSSPHYDPSFWRAVRADGWELRLDWETTSRHLCREEV